MSDANDRNDRKAGKPASRRLLPVVDKSLMPEILPEPRPARSLRESPRERVRSRLLQLSERAAAIAAAASLSAACSDSHGAGPGEAGSGGISAGSGGMNGGSGGMNGGSGGTNGGSGGMSGSGGMGGGGMGGNGGEAGYGVVDPLPPPYLCPEADPLAIEVLSAAWDGGGILLQLQAQEPAARGSTTLDSVTTGAGISAVISNRVSPAAVRVTAQNGDWPDSVELYLAFGCADLNTSTTLRYQIGVRLFTATPATSGNVSYELIDDGADAGM